MKKFLETVQLLFSLLPIITQGMKSVEEQLPGTGRGEEKLALIRTLLEQAYENFTDAKVTFEEIWPKVKVVIDWLVDAYNKRGEFKKG